MPTEAAELVFDETTKVYPGRDGAAVDHLSLTVPAGEICVLVGPSGGGKTTALKLVNRLIPLTSGDIRIDGKSILEHDVTELRRSIGYVIQQVGLFPHMTVEANIGTVPRLLGRPIDGFVADFVGRDRALKALSLRTLGALELGPVGRDGGDGLPRLPAEASLRDALALLVVERRDALLVVDADGSPLGVARRK